MKSQGKQLLFADQPHITLLTIDKMSTLLIEMANHKQYGKTHNFSSSLNILILRVIHLI